ncbi:hypothetical protein I2486_07630 [Cellulophaga sp. E16_2]|uniref:hypothetical protein n=1 Tax=Cellulophaga sp. E16_2 TaxID=2789297 RepID=UPI001A910F43|nr:hypothetical protein [Cellulophaga sp. E16_2]MBO0591277.1 hypothetical protein [Cellulophaga sp. E16_2]
MFYTRKPKSRYIFFPLEASAKFLNAFQVQFTSPLSRASRSWPLRAGIVNKVSHYNYSGASNYVENKGEITVELVDNLVAYILKHNSFLNYEKVLKIVNSLTSKSVDFAERE